MIRRTLFVIAFLVYVLLGLILLIISLVTAPIQYILTGNPWLIGDIIAKKVSIIENKLNNFVEND